MRRMLTCVVFVGLATTIACSGGEPVSEAPDQAPAVSTAPDTEASVAWPASLSPFGEGYPTAGDPCRRLGESEAVVDYLDHTATLVGCPGPQSSDAVRALLGSEDGRVLAEMEGVTLLSIPNRTDSEEAPPSTDDGAGGQFSGSLTGNQTAEHTFTAREGQTINVKLSGSGTMYFNVLPPGGGPSDAIFVGSQAIDADFWAGVAPASGEYTLLLYLMGNDKDSGAERSYTIEAIAE